MGIHVRSIDVTFNISNETRQALGESLLQAEVLQAATQTSTVPAIYQYHFNPQPGIAVIKGLQCETVYNVQFFQIVTSMAPTRRYFVNTFVKTGTLWWLFRWNVNSYQKCGSLN